ncbi:MAG: hypothetical protein AB7O67_16505 [Vicinamibacterales bacterium]
MASSLIDAVRGVLYLRNVPAAMLLDPTAVDLVDAGEGPEIRVWDVDRLGPAPTADDLEDGLQATADAQAAELAARLDEALATGAVIIAAAAENMTVLFPSLDAPSDEQKAAFAAAVKATAKQLLAAQLAGGA